MLYWIKDKELCRDSILPDLRASRVYFTGPRLTRAENGRRSVPVDARKDRALNCASHRLSGQE